MTREVTRVLLIGLMASGKSSVGRAVASRTGWPYVDNDDILQRLVGATAAELLVRDGQQALRAAESQVLTELLALAPPLVAGVPAGVVLDPVDRARLRAGGHVVWLNPPVAALAGRLSGASHRPFLDDDPIAVLSQMAAERNPLYEAVASQVLDTAALSADQAAEQVVAALAPAV